MLFASAKYSYICWRKAKESPAKCCCPHDKDNNMNWIILIIAGFCECSFTFCLGKAKVTTGATHWLWLAGFILFSIASMYLLMRAARTLPLSVAYPVWTGIGAVGTVLPGIFVLHEPTSAMQLFFTFTLVASVIGLKVVS